MVPQDYIAANRSAATPLKSKESSGDQAHLLRRLRSCDNRLEDRRERDVGAVKSSAQNGRQDVAQTGEPMEGWED